MTTEFKVAIGIKEVTIKAESEAEAISKAMADLTANVAWTQATKIAPRATGFHYEPPAPPEQM